MPRRHYPDLHPLMQRTKRNYRSASRISDLLNRDGTACTYCGRPFTKSTRRPTIDHRHPLSRGGADDRSNWALACRDCNQAKADIPESAFRWAMNQLAGRP